MMQQRLDFVAMQVQPVVPAADVHAEGQRRDAHSGPGAALGCRLGPGTVREDLILSNVCCPPLPVQSLVNMTLYQSNYTGWAGIGESVQPLNLAHTVFRLSGRPAHGECRCSHGQRQLLRRPGEPRTHMFWSLS